MWSLTISHQRNSQQVHRVAQHATAAKLSLAAFFSLLTVIVTTFTPGKFLSYLSQTFFLIFKASLGENEGNMAFIASKTTQEGTCPHANSELHAQKLRSKRDCDSFCKYSYITDAALKPRLLIWRNVSYEPSCFLMAEMKGKVNVYDRSLAAKRSWSKVFMCFYEEMKFPSQKKRFVWADNDYCFHEDSQHRPITTLRLGNDPTRSSKDRYSLVGNIQGPGRPGSLPRQHLWWCPTSSLRQVNCGECVIYLSWNPPFKR